MGPRKIAGGAGLALQSTTVNTIDSAVSNANSTALLVQSIRTHIDFFITDQWAFQPVYFFSSAFFGDISTEGLELNGKWYFGGPGAAKRIETPNTVIEKIPTFTWFLTGGYVNKTFKFGTYNITFTGLKLGGGADYQMNDRYFLSGDLSAEMGQGGSLRSSFTIGANISVGTRF